VSLRLIIGLMALVCVPVCGFISTIAFYEMVDRVNEKLPEGRRFSYERWYWFKYSRFVTEYQRLFPDGPLLDKVRVWRNAMFAFIAIFFWALLPFLRRLN
jgi:hypothetical protein